MEYIIEDRSYYFLIIKRLQTENFSLKPYEYVLATYVSGMVVENGNAGGRGCKYYVREGEYERFRDGGELLQIVCLAAIRRSDTLCGRIRSRFPLMS